MSRMAIRNITSSGRDLIITMDDGTSMRATKHSSGYWRTNGSVTPPAEPVDPPPTDEPETPPSPGSGKWAHPLPGATMTSGYGYRGAEFHAGADLSTTSGPVGGWVLAPCDLKITQSVEAGGDGLYDAGSFVKGITRSGTPYTFSFFHMSPGTLAVKKGDEVSAGQRLGREGYSGNVRGTPYGTHLHIETWAGHVTTGFRFDSPWYYGDGTPIDPLPILRANGVQI